MKPLVLFRVLNNRDPSVLGIQIQGCFKQVPTLYKDELD